MSALALTKPKIRISFDSRLFWNHSTMVIFAIQSTNCTFFTNLYALETSWSAKCICSSEDSVILDFFGSLPPIKSPMEPESTLVQNSPIIDSMLFQRRLPKFWPEFKADKIEKRIYLNDEIEKHHICYVLM